MVTILTPLTAKDVHFLQPSRSLKWCERQLSAVKAAIGTKMVLIKHLAQFWCVEDDDIISQLRPRFAI